MGQNLNTSEEQLTAQQLHTNEQLKALQREYNTGCEAAEQVAAGHDAACRDASMYRVLSLR